MGTGLMPGAIQKPITPGANDPVIKPCGVVLHTAVSRSDSLHDFFATKSGGIESHFYVRTDGTIEQYRSIFREADAQLDGNSFMRNGVLVGFVSVETEGMGDDTWTPAQLMAIKKIIVWVRIQSPFPWRVCPAWNEPGIGYHTLFGAPSHWTPVAKVCPGPDRIRQFRATLVPWIQSKATSAASSSQAAQSGADLTESSGMFFTRFRDKYNHDEVIDLELLDRLIGSTQSAKTRTAAKACRWACTQAVRTLVKVVG